MGTTTKTDQSSKFDPGAMQTYQGLQGGLGDMLKGYINSPFSNPFFQTQQQMGTRQAQNLGGMQMGNVARNLTASGLGGGGSMSPFAMEMMQNQGRANTGMQANLGFLNPVQNALGMQQFAGGLASQYRPLQTGQQQTQSTGGLGTWLPQVAGMGLGLLGAGFGGGASSMFGPGGSNGQFAPMSHMLPMAGAGQGAFGEGAGGIGWGGMPGMGSAPPDFGMPTIPSSVPTFGTSAPMFGNP